jgi:hypothetical protein
VLYHFTSSGVSVLTPAFFTVPVHRVHTTRS